ncbi:hypothetical protein CEW89_13755 [Celeribacter ethanolicus]|uniref:DUF4123 domain-containing protein n=1 Tax=Celeribacter ethanolicus TaxID=1758178 RepID=A0A291GEA8_9RHOB|nr:DUF4123 domain-containing protein [Celeribacter ethanolicus]ATG48535.1 hypothetical protein CEW89_13755 [Celeribacter ethanolicus]
MTKFEAWIGECHFTTSGGEEAHCHCAVWADGYATFRAGVEASVLYQNLSLIRLQNVQPVVTLSDVPAHIMELAQAVHSGHPAEMGAMSVIAKHANGHTAESYLTITEHEIAPLSDQTDIPFWDRAWIAPELKELLFCQPQDGPKMRTYLIVDATLRKNVIGAFDLDNVDVPVQCLFKGSAAEELKESAPYLIDMTLPDGAWDDGGLVPAFHKSFFAKHWGHNTGIFIRTTALMAEVCGHFRKFTKVQVEADRTWVFFRFWDPQVARSYFESIQGKFLKNTQWFDIRDGQQVWRVIGDQSDGKQAWELIPALQMREGKHVTGQILLSDTELTAISNYRKDRYEMRAMTFFRKQFSRLADTLSDEQLRGVIRLAYQNAKKRGISSERDHFKYLIIVAFWGSYFEDDPQYQPALNKVLWTNTEYKQFDRLFELIDQSDEGRRKDLEHPMRTLLGFERLYSRPISEITHEAVEERLRAIWPNGMQGLSSKDARAFIDCSGRIGQRLGLNGSDIVAYICLALYFGANFAQDPIYPWAQTVLKMSDETRRRHALGDAVMTYFKNLMEQVA